eukprot:Em0004g1578a
MSDKEKSASPRNGHSPVTKRRTRSRSKSPVRSRSKSYSPVRRKSYSRSRSRSPRRHRSRSRSYSPRQSRHSRYRKRSLSRSPQSNRKRHYNPSPCRVLGVFGLSLYTGEKDLRELFGKYGPMEEVQIVYDHQTGRSRGFAFVYFEDVEDAIDAKEHCNGLEIDGRRIRVDYSITKRPHTPTPGVYMGKPTSSRSRDSHDDDRHDRDRDDRHDRHRGSSSGNRDHYY